MVLPFKRNLFHRTFDSIIIYFLGFYPPKIDHFFHSYAFFLPVAVLSTTGGAAVGDGGGLDPGAV